MTARRLRPAFRGSWILLFGLFFGPATVLSGRADDGRLWPWVLMSTFFLLLLLHRHSQVGLLTSEALIVESWFGLGRPARVSLAGVEKVEVLQGLALRLCGCGHLYVRSSLPEEGSAILLAQARPERLAAELESLGAGARAGASDGPQTAPQTELQNSPLAEPSRESPTESTTDAPEPKAGRTSP